MFGLECTRLVRAEFRVGNSFGKIEKGKIANSGNSHASEPDIPLEWTGLNWRTRAKIVHRSLYVFLGVLAVIIIFCLLQLFSAI